MGRFVNLLRNNFHQLVGSFAHMPIMLDCEQVLAGTIFLFICYVSTTAMKIRIYDEIGHVIEISIIFTFEENSTLKSHKMYRAFH